MSLAHFRTLDDNTGTPGMEIECMRMSDEIWGRATKLREIFNEKSNLQNGSDNRSVKSRNAPGATRQVMLHRLILIRVVWVISLISIFTCYILVSWNVSEEYFHYRTVPRIAIRDDSASNITVPELAVCGRFNWKIGVRVKRIGELFNGDLFNDRNDTWKIEQFRPMTLSSLFKSAEMMTKKFFIETKYCMSLKSLIHFDLDEMNIRSTLNIFYISVWTTSVMHSSNIHGDKEPGGLAKYVYFNLVHDLSIFTNPRKRIIRKKIRTKGFDDYDVSLSYSSFVNIALPPPYDTNCRDYRKDGNFSSSHDCYDQCLKEKTRKWNVVPDITVIDKPTYNQSDAFIVCDGVIGDKENMERNIVKGKDYPKDLRDAYRILQPMWEGIKQSCREACSRPDCWSEDFSPQIVHFEGGVNSKAMKGNHTLTSMKVKLLLSHQPTIEVSTSPKQNLVNYTMYMFSNLNFWIGFCPLALSETIVRKLREWTKRKKRMEKMTLEQKIRKLIRVVENQERVLSQISPITDIRH